MRGIVVWAFVGSSFVRNWVLLKGLGVLAMWIIVRESLSGVCFISWMRIR